MTIKLTLAVGSPQSAVGQVLKDEHGREYPFEVGASVIVDDDGEVLIRTVSSHRLGTGCLLERGAACT